MWGYAPHTRTSFLFIRKYPRGAGAGSLPAKETGLLKLTFEAECFVFPQPRALSNLILC